VLVWLFSLFLAASLGVEHVRLYAYEYRKPRHHLLWAAVWLLIAGVPHVLPRVGG